jgi:hypothetical protein
LVATPKIRIRAEDPYAPGVVSSAIDPLSSVAPADPRTPATTDRHPPSGVTSSTRHRAHIVDEE